MTISAPKRSPKQERFCIALRWTLYVLLLALCFVLQCTGRHLNPLYVIPAAVCISMSEGVLTATGVGMVTGLMIDISCGKLLGLNALFLVCGCVCTALLFMHLLRHNIINVLIVTLLLAAMQGGLDYLFYYYMWNYDAVETVFARWHLPVIFLTTGAVLPLYPIFKLIKRRLLPPSGNANEA